MAEEALSEQEQFEERMVNLFAKIGGVVIALIDYINLDSINNDSIAIQSFKELGSALSDMVEEVK